MSPCNAIAGRILKIDQEGKIVGVLSGPEPGKGRHFDPHQIAVDKDGSIFTAEVMPWRAQKFKAKWAERVREIKLQEHPPV
jgi:hypothetical protein